MVKKLFYLVSKLEPINITKDHGEITTGLSHLGYKVKIITSLTKESKELYHVGDVPILKFSSFSILRKLINFNMFLYLLQNSKSIDIIFCFWRYSETFFALILKVLFNIKLIIRMDTDGNIKETKNPFKNLKRFLTDYLPLKKADLVTIETPEAREKILSKYPWLNKKLILFPAGINIERLRILDEYIHVKSKKNIILFVGKIEYDKGIDILINSFVNIRDIYKNWTLRIVGGANKKFLERMKELIQEHNLNNKIILTGPLFGDDLIREYKNASIFCFTSRHESVGAVLLEAAYFRNSIVSSDVGVARTLLDNGNAGIIIKKISVEQFTKALDKLIKNKNLRLKLGKIIKKRCEKIFSWKKLINDFNNNINKYIPNNSNS
jgi:glycosyltransferase involved in cell wall biosynthesis